jgi:plastocyanin domain-containing protein
VKATAHAPVRHYTANNLDDGTFLWVFGIVTAAGLAVSGLVIWGFISIVNWLVTK